MTEDELFDLLSWIEETVPLVEKPLAFQTEAATLAEGEHGRTSLLVAAGEHWQMRGEYAKARRCFDEALADGGESTGGPVANLFSLALDEGDEEEATLRVRQLRDLAKQDALIADECHHVGETFEVHGRLREAMRWFTIPLAWADEDELDYLCLTGRTRVRRALGLAADRFDVLAQAELDERSGPDDPV